MNQDKASRGKKGGENLRKLTKGRTTGKGGGRHAGEKLVKKNNGIKENPKH